MQAKKSFPQTSRFLWEIPPDISPDELVKAIEWLMNWYCHKPSAFLANLIVTRLEYLKSIEQQGESPHPDWACQRLLKNWEYIAQRSERRVGQ